MKGAPFLKKGNYYFPGIDIKPSFMPVSKKAKDAKLVISLVASQFVPRCGRVIIVSSYLRKNF